MRAIVIFMMLLASGFNAYAADSDKYVMLEMYKTKNNIIDKAYLKGESFNRNECADKILQYFKDDILSEFLNGYVKNGIVNYEQIGDSGIEILPSRYVCVPESVTQQHKDFNFAWLIDLTAMKEISNTIDDGKLDFYTILPFDEESVAHPQTNKLNEAVAKTVFEPSFSCDNIAALRHNEKLVCKSEYLTKKDLEVAKLYKEAIERFDGNKREQVKKEQFEWFESVYSIRYASEGKRLYEGRIKALKDMLDYVICYMETSSYEKNSKAISATCITDAPFSRDECAGKILEHLKEAELVNGYIKNGVVKDEYITKYSPLEIVLQSKRYVCIPEIVVRQHKNLETYDKIDVTAIKEINNTIDENKLDSYSILPFDEESIARPQIDKLNEAVVKTVFEPSFNCDNITALRHNEKLVCRSGGLAERDKRLTKLYKEVIEKFDGNKREGIKKEQLDWIKSTRSVRYASELTNLYYNRIEALEYMLIDPSDYCSGVREIIDNLTIRNKKADKAALAVCVESSPSNDERMLSLQIESGIWLGYLYLDENSPEKADKYIKIAVGIAETTCGESHKNNFCYDYAGRYSKNWQYYKYYSKELDREEELHLLITLLADSITYDMLKYDPKLLSCLNPMFGTSRDNFLVQVKEDLPSKYKDISIEDIVKLDNYKKIAKGLAEGYGGFEWQMGTMRFSKYRTDEVVRIKAAMFPEEAVLSYKDFVGAYFYCFEKEMKEYADVEKAYLAVIENTKKYYKNVFKMPEEKAVKAATFVVQLLIVRDLTENDFHWCGN